MGKAIRLDGKSLIFIATCKDDRKWQCMHKRLTDILNHGDRKGKR